MKSSIMVQDRKSNNRKSGGITIAVIGVGKCVGVTNISIAIAHYIRSLGYSVAILERSRETHFKSMENNLGIKNGDDNGFSYKGVDYYKEVGEETLLKCISLKYDYYVVDVGTGRNAVKEIIRADCKIAVGLGSEWRMNQTFDFYSTYENEEWLNQVKFIINLSTKGKHRLGIECFNVPYIWDKFKVKPEIRQLFGSIIGLY